MTHPDYPDDRRARVEGWTPRPACRARTIGGRTVSLAPFDAALHGNGLWRALGGRQTNERIRWFGWPLLEAPADLVTVIERHALDGWSTSVMLLDGEAAGMASYMREDAANGVVEIGAIAHGTAMARTPAATEAHALLMRHAFSLGYRRYEWKCDDANAASKRAALRLGFTREGTFRQHQVKHGRNRDTAWFSILDGEWPRVEAALTAWLEPRNFDDAGRQRRSLTDIRGTDGARAHG